jgi:hypothetical protein
MPEDRPFYINYHLAVERYRISTNKVDELREEIENLQWYQWLRRNKLILRLEEERKEVVRAEQELNFLNKLKASWDKIAEEEMKKRDIVK